jgi:poly(3-hydroxybutyrate) depolymerase
VLAVHGTDDHTVPIKGGVNSRGVAFPSSDESFKTLGEAMGCSNVVRKGDGEPLPADSPGLDVAVETRTFASCDDGVSVEQWKLFGVDHFMERPTSERLFENVVAWLTALR